CCSVKYRFPQSLIAVRTM
ncbi:hypothetical protein D018_0470, partial [Vibrio parahaemolyticus VP2007-007]